MFFVSLATAIDIIIFEFKQLCGTYMKHLFKKYLSSNNHVGHFEICSFRIKDKWTTT